MTALDLPSSASQACWLGLDSGSARCGLAVSDSSLTLASPLGVVPTQPLDSLGARIASLLEGRSLLGLVAGLPLDQRGAEGESALRARQIGEAVGAQLGLPVEYVDERFTTREMAQRRREAGRSRKQQRGEIDAWAAAAILQAWLDRCRAG